MATDVVTEESSETEAGPLIELTDAAHTKVLEIRAAEDDGDTLALRIEITGINGPDYAYDLSFVPLAEAEETDLKSERDGLTVIVPEASVANLKGATLDLPGNPMQGGLVIRNPNRPDPLAGVDLELTGDLPEKVQQLLDQHVNPYLASHGGSATLVGVDGTKVFVEMGGGCQGCAMSAATLREGIQRSILDALPEVTEVIDATDHDAGENPFYE